MRLIRGYLCVALVLGMIVISIGHARAVLAQSYFQDNANPGSGTTVADSGCTSSNKGNPVLLANNFPGPKVGCTGKNDPILTNVLKLVFGLLSSISLIFIAIGGFKYTTSGGDSNAIVSAKKTILYAVTGLVLGVSAFTILSIVAGLAG